ncbi:MULTISPECIES: isoprenylcysteine carboxylmethyltransferase family protein [Pseudoalteromonas]|jgi:protein-S-isoprenylcysteine O-methyltransferase Ste14|uniref:Isoprenylcysteine carboxylmethyltransferase family protein n=1 Tax=Pseudoalteromonas translucida (strain TAC 125) TaxID=326442 RepID=Q3IKE9_PSET1|nr:MULTISPECIES: isoprenylcysteine carboxylmethyltransferase family protein [Pseudoalteromonas]MBB1369896.1 isoprenylcysteine carboxylmethyltransferase family protein [Pseudoalteromonas sp. SR45-4]MBB1404129.1 isoprenylcysteine carboxylmethyltransferase family protein [Pseudoalteromonas sp. SG44-5]MBE0421440.1 isoprenylcysteine carboxylmethyltransferase family protein [Pseudoalteromonas nigrifaciens]MBH0073413.1 isoprenylcysteine carboxylmethyltransferase family protein [Pseudoalteromonas sp. N|tara:strand:- start:1316 stop:1765 length:450 start_codon:yes stop_codon:yes gene_type:complete
MLNNKIPPLVVVLFFALIMALIAHYSVIDFSAFILYLTVSLVTIGCVFCIAGLVSFRLANTTVNPSKPEQATNLVTSGVYRFSRNPMYVGFVFILLGWGIWLSSLWALLCVAGFIAYLTLFQIIPEERALTQLFGEDYIQYKNKVKRWL